MYAIRSYYAHDLHPDYHSTRFAESFAGVRRVAVQHHHAHLASCLAEHGAQGEAIGVIFDGIGYGADGRIWGGEFLVGGYAGFRRAGHFAYLPMPGGDAATREPYRMALSCLHHAYGRDLPELPLVRAIPEQELRLRITSYNVCYTKLLRRRRLRAGSSNAAAPGKWPGRLFKAIFCYSGHVSGTPVWQY